MRLLCLGSKSRLVACIDVEQEGGGDIRSAWKYSEHEKSLLPNDCCMTPNTEPEQSQGTLISSRGIIRPVFVDGSWTAR